MLTTALMTEGGPIELDKTKRRTYWTWQD